MFTLHDAITNRIPENVAPGRKIVSVTCDADTLKFFIESMKLNWVIFDPTTEEFSNLIPPRLFPATTVLKALSVATEADAR